MRNEDVKAAIYAGLAGGVAIFLYLTVSLPLFFHTPPLALYMWDTSNFLGVHAAVKAGWGGVPIGQTAHIIVSLLWGFIFVLIARRFDALTRYPILAGIVFGVFVMFFMQYIVVPLGHAPLVPPSLPGFLNNLTAHAIFFGVPVAFFAQHFMRENVVFDAPAIRTSTRTHGRR